MAAKKQRAARAAKPKASKGTARAAKPQASKGAARKRPDGRGRGTTRRGTTGEDPRAVLRPAPSRRAGRASAASKRKVRYAVVGLGHIVQAAVLPAFANAKANSELAALVSSDADKLRQLGKRYRVDRLVDYDGYDDLLRSGEVDAVFLGLPNDQHAEFTIRAADAGVHVLCEKPMAVTVEECEAMIAAAERNDVKLMIAYRLHFEAANLAAVELVQAGKLGDVRLFTSTFTMDVKEGDIRLQAARGGGTVYDIGVYCINAARYLLRDEPTEVFAVGVSRDDDPRFAEVDEATSAILRFPGDRLASFTTSFGSASVGEYRLVGTEGDLHVEPAYSYAKDIRHRLTVGGGKTKEKTFRKRDQFGPELVYFSDCILRDAEPEPSGWEGLLDVRIVEAIYESARRGEPVRLPELARVVRPEPEQEIERPAVEEPELVDTESPKR